METTLEKVWQCTNQKCAAVLPEAGVKFIKTGRNSVAACSRCGARMLEASKHPERIVEDVGEVFEFSAMLPQTFLYPFLGNGIFTLAIATFIFSAAHFVAIMGLLTLGVNGYLAAYFFEIVLTTATGADTPPDWPDFSDLLEDIIRPFAKYFLALCCGFLPLAVFLILFWHDWSILGVDQWTWVTGMGVLLLAPFGVFYFPMALLAIAMFDSFSAVNPVRVFNSIFRVLLPYLVVCFLLAFVLVVKFVFPVVLGNLIPQWMALFLSQFLSLYLSMVTMRMLGILYRAHQKKLEWF